MHLVLFQFSDNTVKKSNTEFTANFNTATATHGENGQYQFTFDPSLQDNTQGLVICFEICNLYTD